MNSARYIKNILLAGKNPLLMRIDEPKLKKLQEAFFRWLKKQQEKCPDDEQHQDWLLRRFSDFLIAELKRTEADLKQREQQLQVFQHRFRHAATDEERRHHILEFSSKLGGDAKRLNQDRHAFDRWFSEEALRERYFNHLISAERYLVLLVEALGRVAARWLENATDLPELRTRWQALALSSQYRSLLLYMRDARIRQSALQSIGQVVAAIPRPHRSKVLEEGFVEQLLRLAKDRTESTWVQCEAMASIKLISLPRLEEIVVERLTNPAPDDDLFVRRRALLLLPAKAGVCEQYPQHEMLAAQDSSPYVRQALLQRIAEHGHIDSAIHYGALLQHDLESSVRVAALSHLAPMMNCPPWHEKIAQWLTHILQHESQEVVLRAALKILADCHLRLWVMAADSAERWLEPLLPVLEQLHFSADSLVVRASAAQCRERLWCQSSAVRMAALTLLQEQLLTLPLGRRVRIGRHKLPDMDELTLGRLLALIAQHEHGFDIAFSKRYLLITRGEHVARRLWRILHEFFRPSTDKRQGFSHTTGRHYRGTLYAPSGVLAEQAQTKVPGEPLQMEEEGGWRNYLPLVDELLSACEQDKVTVIRRISSAGITEITPPRSLLKRLWVMQQLTRRFSEYAGLRNWQTGDTLACEAYVNAIRALGFEVSFKPHQYDNQHWRADPAVSRFFPVMIPLSGYDWGDRIADYFVSVYENSLQHLAIVLAVGCSGFFARHLYLVRRIRNARKKLPLVIGGWGTRGKSGTERLKAALFNALGYNVMSKTTGCEAMFLYSRGYSEMKEMFLFRPYDKATIWEQEQLLQISTALDTEVFLWECMALNPDFVSILQRQWMNDDIATITNCYPDHENLQGPAGINIPQVMQRFIPRNSCLVTSEENMLPLLRDEARHQKSRLHAVGWLQAAQLTPDILQRFPYQEHPYNIALILGLCKELGITEDFALKEMADRVVEDLGVLKCYPQAKVAGRRLEFINGMSANERFGTLDNWKRVGLSEQSKQWSDECWIATVVNNRADRVVRSQVFAEILVNDIQQDRCYLIGSNLEGLQSYIHLAWHKLLSDFTLWRADISPETALANWQQWAERLRIPTCRTQLDARLQAQLKSLELLPYAEQLAANWDQPEKWRQILPKEPPYCQPLIDSASTLLRQYQAFCNFAEQLPSAADASQRHKLDQRAQQILGQWFEDKFVVIEDARASGEKVIQQIIDTTPPGILARVMGLQNIKGTGLDFIYRLQAWEACYRICERLQSTNASQVRSGLRTLVDFHEFGQLSESHLNETLNDLHDSPLAQTELVHAELELITSRHREAMKTLRQELEQGAINGLLEKAIDSIESFADVGDAVRRRKQANQIYKDLVNERISSGKATTLLKALNRRQKGGWLVHSRHLKKL